MHPDPTPTRRSLLGLAAAGLAAAALPARAQRQMPTPTPTQEVPIRFQLDWRFDGPAAMFLLPLAKGYFRREKLDVGVDAGNGSSGTVARIASGSYDMGFADLATLMEFHGNNPNAADKPVAVMMVYNNLPAAVLALKKSGIKTPAGLSGRKLGAPLADAGRRAWPIFAQANRIEKVTWTAMDPPLRETMLVRGDVDAITGYSFVSRLNLEARGVKADEIVVFPYADHGVKFYGNAIIVSQAFLNESPQAVKAFLRAFTKGMHDVIADPKAAVAAVKAREGSIDAALEERRLKLALDAAVLTQGTRAEGFGNALAPRLHLMASQVSDAFATKVRVHPDAVWNNHLLPPASERNLFAAVKH